MLALKLQLAIVRFLSTRASHLTDYHEIWHDRGNVEKLLGDTQSIVHQACFTDHEPQSSMRRNDVTVVDDRFINELNACL